MEKIRPSVTCDSFSLRLCVFPVHNNRVAASSDPIRICHHLASVFISLHVYYSISDSNLLPSLLVSFVVPPPFIHYRPTNLSDRFGTGPDDTGVDSRSLLALRFMHHCAQWRSESCCVLIICGFMFKQQHQGCCV